MTFFSCTNGILTFNFKELSLKSKEWAIAPNLVEGPFILLDELVKMDLQSTLSISDSQ